MRSSKKGVDFKKESKKRVEDKSKPLQSISGRIVGGEPLEDYLRRSDKSPKRQPKSTINPLELLKRRNERDRIMKRLKKNPQQEFKSPSRGRKLV